MEKDTATDYGKVSIALDKMKHSNIKVDLPNINIADYTFVPHKENNSIVYGLFAISGINKDIVKAIIENRPYNSLNDFLSKVKVTKTQALNLIKAGAFDEIENKHRLDILYNYVNSNLKLKNNLTTTNLLTLIEKGITKCDCYKDDCEYCLQVRFVKYRKYIFNKNNKVKVDGSKKDYYKLDSIATSFFDEHFIDLLVEGKHYIYNENGEILVEKTNFDKVYKVKIEGLLNWIKEAKTINLYNEMLFKEELEATKSNKEVSEMEMQSLNYYYTEHYLDSIDLKKYGVKSFFDLDESPKITFQRVKNGFTFNTYETCRLAGTIVEVDKPKHTLYLSTIEGVVSVKFRNKGAFNHYTKQISIIQDDGTKKVIEKPWISRHNNILVSGYRIGDIFYVSKMDGIEHTVSKINGKYKDMLILQTERAYID